MLNDLKAFGIQNGYFEIKKIGDFSQSEKEGILHINIEAIDFDKTKKIVCERLSKEQCKSCDALDLVDSKNRVNFIEFKQLKSNNLESWIKEKRLPQKIKDSNSILLDIINMEDFKHRDKVAAYLSCGKKIIIAYSFPSNKTSRTGAFMYMIVLRETIEKEFRHFEKEFMDTEKGGKFNDPILMKIDEFDLKYPQHT